MPNVPKSLSSTSDHVPVNRGLIEDGPYRYAFWESWDDARRQVLFIGLKPTSDHSIDPVIRKGRNLARTWGYGGLRVGHLHARKDWAHVDDRDPFGPDNDRWLKRMAAGASMVICCWGSMPSVRGAEGYIRSLVMDDAKLFCMGRRTGYPLALQSVPPDAHPEPLLKGA